MKRDIHSVASRDVHDLRAYLLYDTRAVKPGDIRKPRDKSLRPAMRLDECIHGVEGNRDEFDKDVCRPRPGNGPVVDEFEGFLLRGDDECFLHRRSHGCGECCQVAGVGVGARCTWEVFYIRSGYRANKLKSGALVTTFIDSQCKVLKLSTHYRSFDWMLLRS